MVNDSVLFYFLSFISFKTTLKFLGLIQLNFSQFGTVNESIKSFYNSNEFQQWVTGAEWTPDHLGALKTLLESSCSHSFSGPL